MRRFIAKFRALLHAAWAEALVYRAQIFIWAITGVLPLVMLAVWRSLAAGSSIGGYSGDDFVAYYIGAIVLRQITGVWIIWDLERAIRLGELSPHLLRPAHPLLRYLALALCDKPLRLMFGLPLLAAAALIYPGAFHYPGTLSVVALPLAVVLAFIIYFCMQCSIGLLGFWLTQTLALQDFWFGIYALASGYLLPLDLFPPGLAAALRLLPFRALLSFPLDLMLGRLSPPQIAEGLLLQVFWAAAFVGLLGWLWRTGIRRYSAVGA
jgi:ABC-2 type transport system permease protein